jgi:hypothetical protein
MWECDFGIATRACCLHKQRQPSTLAINLANVNESDDSSMIKQCKCGLKFHFIASDFVTCPKCKMVVHNGTGYEDNEAILGAWGILHYYAPKNATKWNPQVAQQWYAIEWLPMIPSCGECRVHWAELTRQHPPDFSTPRAFFEWSWARHNDVSINHSHRPTITLEQAYAMYWPNP